MASTRWILAQPDPARVERLERDVAIRSPLAAALVNRGLDDPAGARAFLNPRLAGLGDPFALPNIRPAIARLVQALDHRERIVIYGDYDVDGVTSSALLRRVLDQAGATVANFLPLRRDEGYGLSEDGLDRCLAEHHPQLLMAVDCGTTAVAPIARLQQLGVDVIVLDHHEPGPELPVCVALVNPLLAKGVTPYATVGIAFKFAHALLKDRPELAARIDLRDHLDLVALGTIADMVPLTHENRVFARAGLDRLARSTKPGLRALRTVAGLGERVTPSDVGYRLGPRLNAAGRLDTAMHALEILLTENRGRAEELAAQLDEQNRERQTVQARTVGEALEQLQHDINLDRDFAVVLAREGWHPGVVGIVASRVLQEAYRPTIVIAVENGVGKGSCRSIEGFSMVAALDQCADLLIKHGGHEMAAGLTIAADQIEAFRARFNDIARERLQPGDLAAAVHLDGHLALGELEPDFFDQLAQFDPCGIGNPSPCFVVRGQVVPGTSRVLKEKHLKFRVRDETGTAAAIWWGGASTRLPAGRLEIACVPELNVFRGAATVQLRVRAVRSAG